MTYITCMWAVPNSYFKMSDQRFLQLAVCFHSTMNELILKDYVHDILIKALLICIHVTQCTTHFHFLADGF